MFRTCTISVAMYLACIALTGCIQNPDSFEAEAQPDAGSTDDAGSPGCDGDFNFCGDPADGTGRCVDLQSDPNHCGECDNECSGDDTTIGVCDAGSCTTACDSSAGFAACTGPGECTDLNTDPDHCGSCGNVCPTDECEAGRCVPFDCDPDEDPFGGGNGTASSPYTICSPAQLQEVGTEWDAHFALSDDITIPEDAEFEPIGYFSGVLDGFGFSIHDLTIHRHQLGVGLFAMTDQSARVRNLTLENFDIENEQHPDHEDNDPHVGAISAYNLGVIEDVTLRGGQVEGHMWVGAAVGLSQMGRLVRVEVEDTAVRGGHRVGGVVGRNEGLVEGSSVDEASSVYGRGFDIGGLVGENRGGIVGSTAAGDVLTGEAVEDGSDNPRAVGGLVGVNTSTGVVMDSTASGELTASGDADVGDWSGRIGGLVGDNQGTILGSASYTGIESERPRTGGLVGRLNDNAHITSSYASGQLNTSGGDRIGGLVGAVHGSGAITQSFATVDVNAADTAGGVAGKVRDDTASISDCYAMGDVDAEHTAGGLIGQLEGTVSRCYQVGDVTADDNVGALVGSLGDNADVSGSFWNEDFNSQTDSPGGGTIRDSDGFGHEGYFEVADWDLDDVWIMPQPEQVADSDFVRPRLRWEFEP